MLQRELELRLPRASDSVYTEDCTQCFDSLDDPTGLDVCLSCFNGGCTGSRNHASLHYRRSSHPLVLNIRRSRKKVQRDEPPAKISKLAILAEKTDDKYEMVVAVRCHACDLEVDKTTEHIAELVEGVLKANTFAKKSEIQAWEQEMVPCEHTLCLEQSNSREIEAQDLGHCYLCDLKENLWLCLSCGTLGCGRSQYGGNGGNGHALKHFEDAVHPVAVKLGSITPEGTADIYCYACNDERIDPDIAKHLAHWGVILADRKKTEQSLTELQIEQNLKWEFAMTSKDGQELRPLFGPGLTGLKNLGNSCYLASVLQCLVAIPEFAKRYRLSDETALPETSTPAEDLETQLRKVADGLLSGRYSTPENHGDYSENTTDLPTQKGLAPAMLKHLVGRGHEEFSTMRQQDAFELLLHLFKLISRSTHQPPLVNPVESFRFVLEQKLQCTSCRKVRYKLDEQDNISIPVPVRKISASGPDEFAAVTIQECLDKFTALERVELTCPSCSSRAGFEKQSRFKTFPQNLVVNARRFALVNWVPVKLDIAVIIGDTPFDVTPYMSPGQQDGEELLPEDDETDATSKTKFVPNAAAMSQLGSMGFPPIRCEKALNATGNGDAEAAMNWLFQHMEDADIDEPLALGQSMSGQQNVPLIDPASVSTLGAMGIPEPQARKALMQTDGDVNRALDWVFSHPDDLGDIDGEQTGAGEGVEDVVGQKKTLAGRSDVPISIGLDGIVCHKGASIHAGHYVAFVRKEFRSGKSGSECESRSGSGSGSEGSQKGWVLFNDERVVEAAGDVEEMKKFAYVYFFRRVQEDT